MNTGAEHEEETETQGWLQLALLPLILFQLMRQLFAALTDDLKSKRRTHKPPADWQARLFDLRNAEWPIHVAKGEGARRILAGEPLDYLNIPITQPPADQLWNSPRSAEQTQLRMIAMTRFHADPERYIRRHAARLLRCIRLAAARATATTIEQPAPPAPPAATTTILLFATPRRAGLRVRAPPWRLMTLQPKRSRLAALQRGRGRLGAGSQRTGPGQPYCPKSLSTGGRFRRVLLSNRRHNES